MSVSLSEEAAEAIDHAARQHGSTASGVIEAAAQTLRAGGREAAPIERRIGPANIGGPRPGAGRPSGGAREQVIDALKALTAQTGRSDHKVEAIVAEAINRGSKLQPSTIRTHIVSRMCAQAPVNHATVYADLDRLGGGFYRLRSPS